VKPVPLIENEPPSIVDAASVDKFEPIGELVIVEQVVVEDLCAASPEFVSESPSEDEKHDSAEVISTVSPVEVEVTPSAVDEGVRLEDVSKNVENYSQTENVSKKVEAAEEIPDDTIGPGDSRSSESESSEESEVETIEPVPLAPAKIPKQVPKQPLPVVKKTAPVSPLFRKVVPAPVPSPRSSWSRFLPLVIEIKATIPYPMHLLGFFLLLVTGLLLRQLYQFGADLGAEMELQGQFVRFAKLALLFFVVAMCVNFVEDNKEISANPASPVQPKLRPSKLSKNKKKMMLKV